MTPASQGLLHIENLVLHFKTTRGVVQAVDGVDFDLGINRAVVILGESGCGKTSLSRALLRLLPRNVEKYSGKVVLQGTDVMELSDEEYRTHVRWVNISLVPQAAMNSLNPVLTVGEQVAEPATVHLGLSSEDAMGLVARMFKHVGVPLDFMERYPFEMSGGMRQRVALAMALVTSPGLIVLDEPTSALDLLTQANIMNVLKRLKHELGTSFILITHDIATSSELADEVAIMYSGQIVETGCARDFFPAPLHPYSQMLMASVPRLHSDSDPMFIMGQPPSLMNPPQGCRFAARCPFRFAKCSEEPPIFRKGNRSIKCWLHS